MILVRTCCGCISLKKGTIAIGSFSLITAVLNTVAMGVQISTMYKPPTDRALTGFMIVLKMLIVSALIYCILSIVVSALLIFGAAKRLSGHVFPWLAITFGSIVTLFCTTIGFTIIAAIECSVSEFFFILISLSAVTALPIYFWRVVYSYYKELVAEKFGHQSRPNDGKIMFSPPYQNV